MPPTKKILLPLILLCIIVTSASAQFRARRVSLGGMGYAFGGYGLANFSGLESSLRSSNLITDEWNAGAINIGGGGFALVNERFIFMGQGYAFLFSDMTNDAANISRVMGGGGVNVGYAVYNDNHQLIFPTIGIGGGGLSMVITNRDTVAISFGTESINPSAEKTFHIGDSYLDFNLNYHKLFDLQRGRDVQGLTAGISVGYLYGLGENDWVERVDGSLITDTEKEKLGIFYVRLLFGGGGFYH